jgi:hypothetical protein
VKNSKIPQLTAGAASRAIVAMKSFIILQFFSMWWILDYSKQLEKKMSCVAH